MIDSIEQIAKALGDKQRLRILKMLESGELCVCEITEVLDLAPATVSKHLSVLKAAGLLDSEKRGKWVYYGLPKKIENKFAKSALKKLRTELVDDPIIHKDEKALKKVTSKSLEEMCA